MSFKVAGTITDSAGHIGTDAFNVAVPAVVDGDLLIMMAYRAVGTGVFNAPAGWTEITAIKESRTSSDAFMTFTAYRVASAEPTSYSLTHTETESRGQSAVIVAYENIDAAIFDVTPVDAHAVQEQNNNTPIVPSITTVTDGAILLALQWISSEEITAVAPPTDFTLRVNHTPFNDRNILIADKVQTVAGAVSPGAWLHTTSAQFGDGATAVIALKPSASPSITSVDADNVINPSQTDVAIQLANAPASVTTLHEIKVGGTVSGETITGGEAMDNIRWNSGTPLFDVPSGATLGTGLAIHVRYTE